MDCRARRRTSTSSFARRTSPGPSSSLLGGLGFTLAAAPVTFRAGVRVHRVSRVEGDELLTVDLLEADGPVADAFDGRLRVDWGERSLCVVSREGLVAMKRLASRPRDLADLEALGETADE